MCLVHAGNTCLCDPSPDPVLRIVRGIDPACPKPVVAEAIWLGAIEGLADVGA